MNQPTCGHCGYDLTGAESNRCPECGLLFIEAGVTFRRRSPWNRLTGRIGITLLLLLVAGVGWGLTYNGYLRACAARDKAIAQQQAALARRQYRIQYAPGGNAKGTAFDGAIKKKDYSNTERQFNRSIDRRAGGTE